MNAMTKNGLLGLLAAAVLVLGLAGCGSEGAHSLHAPSVLETVAQDTTFQNNAGLRSDGYLDGVATVPVEGLTALADVPPFAVAQRTPHLKRYPCQTCHETPLAALKAPEGDLQNAHWDVQLNHATPAVMDCQTCHTPDLSALQLLRDTPVSFDHSYQVCAQCHSSQAKDWVGGAHGKRLGGWAPPRVVNNCVACHNPHSPAFEPRFPARASRLAE